MASIHREPAGRSIRTLFGLGAVGGLSDSELIGIYLDRRGEASELAFSAIVDRHGPMVLGVCRRMLGDRQAAEDAFQATFLILARKAGSVRVEGSIGRWLHGVGRRVATRARRVRSRESAGLGSAAEPSTMFEDPIDRDEVRLAVDEEVGRLPRHYRAAVILCHLEGLTHDRAAEALGCPVGTVRSRLSRAREMLRKRLTRRGLAPVSVAAMLAADGGKATASMPVVRGLASVAASGLARHFLRTIMIQRMIQFGLAATLAAGLVGTGGLAMVGGQEPAPVAKIPAPPRPLKERFDELVQDQYRRRTVWIEANRADKPWAERTEAERKLERPETPEWARKYLAILDEDPTGPVAPDALFRAFLSVAYPGFLTGGKPEAYARIREERAMAEAIVDRFVPFVADPRMSGYCHAIGEGLGLRAEVLLREVLVRSPDRRSRGFACQSLGTLLGYFAQTRLLHDDPWIAEAVRREVGQGFLDGLKGRDPRAMAAEAEALHQRVVAEFGDIRLDLDDPEETEVLAAESLKWLARARCKDVGRLAPEINDDDVQGRRIQLGAYRGKVVVLTFWASWSPRSLREASAHRILAATFRGRPFALLGVDLDHDAVIARKSMAQNQIDDPTWFDGGSIKSDHTGVISTAYNVVELPTVLVIDAKGVIRARGLKDRAIEIAVEALLREAEEQK